MLPVQDCEAQASLCDPQGGGTIPVRKGRRRAQEHELLSACQVTVTTLECATDRRVRGRGNTTTAASAHPAKCLPEPQLESSEDVEMHWRCLRRLQHEQEEPLREQDSSMCSLQKLFSTQFGKAQSRSHLLEASFTG